jgi:hypothetical protein
MLTATTTFTVAFHTFAAVAVAAARNLFIY